MLGMEVKTTLYGCLSDCGLYSGYISVDSMKNTPVYIVSDTHPKDYFIGRVIASMKCGETDKLIIAPRGKIFYQSRIKEVLLNSKRVDGDFQLKCFYEKSCGAVIFYRGDDGVKLLLVRNCNGRYWSFPKGHMEPGEDEYQTALREVYEETGLEVEIFKGYRQVSEYSPYGNIQKRVVYFVAETKNDRVKIQRSEIESYVWVSIEQAYKMCCYQNDSRILETAEKAIKEQTLPGRKD